VAGKRESLGIIIFAPQRVRWSKREIELLGKRPDRVVAAPDMPFNSSGIRWGYHSAGWIGSRDDQGGSLTGNDARR